MIILRNP